MHIAALFIRARNGTTISVRPPRAGGVNYDIATHCVLLRYLKEHNRLSDAHGKVSGHVLLGERIKWRMMMSWVFRLFVSFYGFRAKSSEGKAPKGIIRTCSEEGTWGRGQKERSTSVFHPTRPCPWHILNQLC